MNEYGQTIGGHGSGHIDHINIPVLVLILFTGFGVGMRTRCGGRLLTSRRALFFVFCHAGLGIRGRAILARAGPWLGDSFR
jgi:hypothetical protein